MLRQEGRCADCGTRLIIGFFVFDHRPPLALREIGDDVNDPERLAAICWTCNEQKTPKDLKDIARTKRIAQKHQEFLEGQREKVPGRRLPSPRQRRELERALTRPVDVHPSSAADTQHDAATAETEQDNSRAGR